MQPLAFWMPGPWEIVILGACGFFFLAMDKGGEWSAFAVNLGACCFFFLVMAVAVVLVVIYLTRRKSQGQPQEPSKPQ